MSINPEEGNIPIPADAGKVIQALEGMLAEIADYPEEAPDEFDVYQAEVATEVVEKLRSRGIVIPVAVETLLDSQTLAEDPSVGYEDSERCYFAAKITYGIAAYRDRLNGDKLGICGNEEFPLREAVARISANTALQQDEISMYLDVVKELVGEQHFTAMAEAMLRDGDVEQMRSQEVSENQKRVQDQLEEERQLEATEDMLIGLGVSPDHDDFDLLVSRINRIYRFEQMGALDNTYIMAPTQQRVVESAIRMGIDKVTARRLARMEPDVPEA